MVTRGHIVCAAGECQPYCVLSVDDPPQSYVTSPVTNSVNPFFDEQFILYDYTFYFLQHGRTQAWARGLTH